jgi:hydroxymethylglutaryl-CoA synthase
MVGIVDYGTYVPRSRLDRADIGAALATAAGRGSRSVASYDEDTTTLGFEAARDALRGSQQPATVLFATSRPAYGDKTNATAIHAALDLGQPVGAFDMAGSVRCGLGALRCALQTTAPGHHVLAVLADIRFGRPGSGDEASGGDGAAAYLCGSAGVIAELVTAASRTRELLERWRDASAPTSSVWEERFAESVILPLGRAAVTDVCTAADIDVEAIDHVVITGTSERAVRQLRRAIPGRKPRQAITDLIGNSGAAAPGLDLADALDTAAPGDTILVLSLADGADALLLRATPEITSRQGGNPATRALIEQDVARISYPVFLTWRGLLVREPPRRPEPDRPSAPASYRAESWKFAFAGSRCASCGSRQLPPARVCLHCGAVDKIERERLADVPGTITTFTVDRLAYSLSPPVIVAVVDFEGGGRFQCEMTDTDPAAIAIGNRVEMTFRRLFTAQGVHNYFWKARPARTSKETNTP